MVRCDEIKGLMLEKHQVYGNENVRTKARKENRNRLIIQQGSKCLRMNREKLAYFLWKKDKLNLNFNTWNFQKEPKSMEFQYGLKADYINENLKDLLEVVT